MCDLAQTCPEKLFWSHTISTFLWTLFTWPIYVQESWQCFTLISLYVICQCDCHRRQTQDDAWWEANGNHGRWAFSHDTRSQINIDLVIYALFMNMHIDVCALKYCMYGGLKREHVSVKLKLLKPFFLLKWINTIIQIIN